MCSCFQIILNIFRNSEMKVYVKVILTNFDLLSFKADYIFYGINKILQRDAPSQC